MSYCVAADVASEFKNIDFGAASAIVKTAQVTEWAAQASALIDSHLGMRYAVPVTEDATALALLKLYAISLVANRVRSVLHAKGGDVSQAPTGALSTKDVLEALKMLQDGSRALSGATALVAASGFASGHTDNNDDEDYTFNKGVKEW